MNYGSNWPGETTALPVEEWGLWTQRASRLMDRLTLGRAAQHAEELAEPLGDACLQIAQHLAVQRVEGLLAVNGQDGVALFLFYLYTAHGLTLLFFVVRQIP